MSRLLHKLDKLLQAWARQRAADAPTLHRLRAQILAAAVRPTARAAAESETIVPLVAYSRRSRESYT